VIRIHGFEIVFKTHVREADFRLANLAFKNEFMFIHKLLPVKDQVHGQILLSEWIGVCSIAHRIYLIEVKNRHVAVPNRYINALLQKIIL